MQVGTTESLLAALKTPDPSIQLDPGVYVGDFKLAPGTELICAENAIIDGSLTYSFCCRVEGITVMQSAYVRGGLLVRHGVTMLTGDGILKNAHIYNINGIGIVQQGGKGTLIGGNTSEISGCRVHDISYSDGIREHGTGVYAHNRFGGKRLFEHNIFWNCARGIPLHMFSGDLEGRNSIQNYDIRHNTVFGRGVFYASAAPTRNVTIEGNYFSEDIQVGTNGQANENITVRGNVFGKAPTYAAGIVSLIDEWNLIAAVTPP